MAKDFTDDSEVHPVHRARGRGGKGSKGPSIDKDNISTSHILRVVEAICEGPVKSISPPIFGGTPLIADDGSRNFKGITYAIRYGLPSQSPLPNITGQEAETIVDAQVIKATPVIRTITDPDTDDVKVQVKIPSLFYMNKKNGDMKRTSVSYRVQYRPSGAANWIEAKGSPFTLSDKKATSAVFRVHRFTLTGAAPWDIRVVRDTNDSPDPSEYQNDTYFYSYTQILNQKFSYPNTAHIGIIAKAEQFGASVPDRGYLVEGLICRVPSNFNPITRVYTGVWNGTFKDEWTDCPAWCTRELLRNPRWGLGRYFPIGYIDDTTLYAISQYCAAQVPNGKGGTEHRFTFNAYINTRQEAFQLLNSMVSVFRGMVYYGFGSILFTADQPRDPMLTVTRANTINGEFVYKGASLMAQHNRVNVTYNDPKNGYKREVVSVDLPDDILKNGLRATDIVAFGCTSESQAMRAGRWLLYTERMESETVTYVAGEDHTDAGPGVNVRLFDPSQLGTEMGGRLVATGTATVKLDRPVTLTAGQGYELVLHDRERVLFYRQLTNAPGAPFTVATLSVPLPNNMTPNPTDTVWAIRKTTGPDTVWRVISNSEVGKGQYEITAVRYERSKFQIIEEGLDIPDFPAPLLPVGRLPPPRNLYAKESAGARDGSEDVIKATVSFTRPVDPRVRGVYLRYAEEDEEWRLIDLGLDTTIDLNNLQPGRWRFEAQCYGSLGLVSEWTATHINDFDGNPVGGVIDNITGAVLRPGIRLIGVKWKNPALSNFKNVEIWTNTTNAIGTATLAATTSAEHVTLSNLESGVPLFLWSRVNALGPVPRASTFQYLGTTTPRNIVFDDLDTTPPGIPTGLTLTSDIGNLYATWNASTAADIAEYEVGLTVAGGNQIWFPTSGTRMSWPMPPNTPVVAQLRAVDRLRNKSLWGNPVSHTTARDTVAPDVPTGLRLRGSFNTIFMTWNENSEPDFHHYEIVMRLTPFTPNFGAAADFSTRSALNTIIDLPNLARRWIAIRAVDTSGNKSPWSPVLDATTLGDTAITNADLMGLIDATSFAQTLTPTELVSVLPGAPHKAGRVVYNTTNNTIYRNDGTKWTAEVESSNIVGKLIAGQIAAGAIGVEQLAFGAATGSKLGIGDFTNLIPDSSMVDAAAWNTGTQTTFNPTSANMTPKPRAGIGNVGIAPTGTGTVGVAGIPFQVTAGDQILAAFDARRLSGTTGTGNGYIRFYNVAGTLLSPVPLIGSKTTSPAETISNSIDVPTGAVTAAIYFNVVGGQGTSWAFSAPLVMRKNKGEMIVDGELKANHVTAGEFITLSAQIKEATIINAHVVDLNANKLIAGSSIVGSVLVDGQAIGTLGGDRMFDAIETMWDIPRQAGGTMDRVVSGVENSVGTHVLRGLNNGPAWAISPTRMVYDPNKLYKITFQLRRAQNPVGSNPTQGTYLGLCGFAGDKVTKVNTAGNDTDGNQHFFMANAPQSSIPITLTNYTYYFKGRSATPGGAGTLANPKTLHTGVRYISPMAIFNYGAEAGNGSNMNLGFAKIDVVDEDGADVINTGSTFIEPGKIRILGNTTLANWRTGGDETRINGGMLSSNTVQTNALTVGNRNLTLLSIRFTHNTNYNAQGEIETYINRCTWTGGAVRWINDDGLSVQTSIVQGSSMTYTGNGPVYVYWRKGEGIFRTTIDGPTAFAENAVVLATYQGGANVDADYGRTVVDADGIVTDAIRARHVIKTQKIIAVNSQLGDAVADTLNLVDGAVTLQWASNSLSIVVTTSYAAKLIIFTNIRIMGTFDTHNTYFELFRQTKGQAEIRLDRILFSVDEYTNPYTNIRTISCGAGEHTFRHSYTRNGNGTATNFNTARIAVFGAYK